MLTCVNIWFCVYSTSWYGNFFIFISFYGLNFFRYLFCIVSSCFYVTESQSTKNRLLFYRKPIWRRVVRIASTEFARRCQFQPAAKLKNELPFYGPFALRWVPKSNGEVRPIIFGRAGPQRRSNKSKGGYGGTVKAMNYDLRPVLAIAQFLVRSRPEVLGKHRLCCCDL